MGAGHAAGQAAASLRQEKYEGKIIVLGDEPVLPYQRPPLSKAYLSGEQEQEKLLLRAAAFYEKQNIEVKTSTSVTEINPQNSTIRIDDREDLSFEHLLIATGSRVRKINVSGSELNNIHYLRTIEDVDQIRSGMAKDKKLVIVGGGYIGLEVAAIATQAGLNVRVLETEDRVLQRVTTPTMSNYYTRLHEKRGVRIHTKTRVIGFEGKSAVERVVCDNDVFDADLVIVGIGIIPNSELAEKAGIACENGITVDERCQTSIPRIYAAGDCTNHPNPLLNRRLRLESVPNAMEQARVCAANMVGKDKIYSSIPWFWSDQYELKLQMVGFSSDGDSEVVRGDMDANQFSVFHVKENKVMAADSVNSPKDFMICKQLIGKEVDLDKLLDESVELKSML